MRRNRSKIERDFEKQLKLIATDISVQSKELPYSADFFIKKLNLVININGCFWHNHGCVNSKIPEKNTNYWLSVFEKNKARDYENTRKLKILGYKIINIWECVLRDDKSKKRLFNNLEKILQTV